MSFSEAKLAIVGAGGHGLVVADAAESSGKWSSFCFFDDSVVTASSKNSFPSVGFQFGSRPGIDGDFLHLLSNCGLYDGVVVGVGNNVQRMLMAQQLTEAGARLVSIVHPSAVISKYCLIGKGSVVLAGAVVNYGAVIGQNCILNTGSHVDHHCQIGDGVHISPGAAVAGRVNVGHRSWVGIGSTIKDGVSIGEDAVVGAGAVVIRNVEDHTTVVGVPATIMKSSS